MSEMQQEPVRSEIVALYQGLVADVMLNRIVLFGGDARFCELVLELCQALAIEQREATALLHPVADRIYKAAVQSAQMY